MSNMINLNNGVPSVLGILGNSGCGKTTLGMNLVRDYPEIFTRSTQYTTRLPRADELPGYVFVPSETYEQLAPRISARTTVNGNKYGTCLSQLSLDKVNVMPLTPEAAVDLLADPTPKNIIFLTLVHEEGEGRENRDAETETAALAEFSENRNRYQNDSALYLEYYTHYFASFGGALSTDDVVAMCSSFNNASALSAARTASIEYLTGAGLSKHLLATAARRTR